MNHCRILLLSNVRPSRTWRIAECLKREAGAEVCGIVQRPLRSLPQTQQLITTMAVSPSSWFSRSRSRLGRWVASAIAQLMHCVVWMIHGCPPRRHEGKFTIKKMTRQCQESGSAFLLIDHKNEDKICGFVRDLMPDIIVIIGHVQPSPELLGVPSRGLIRVLEDDGQVDPAKGFKVIVEYYKKQSQSASPIANLNVPVQIYDDWQSVTLKLELIADDLLLQTVRKLTTGTATTAKTEVSEWMHKIFGPYLAQLEPVARQSMNNRRVAAPCRSGWKLCLDTLILCSPFFLIRNCYRRLRRRYPVIILAHHLVSDRPHRMGMPTHVFWQAIRFLSKHYQIVSLSEAMQLLSSGNVSAPTLVITFDDGYGENFVNLRAVAVETGVPVVMFVSTEPVNENREFEHDLARHDTGALPLTWDQIRYWDRRGVEFGSHTRTHFDCGSNDQAKLEREIKGSRQEMEKHLGKPVDFFAFPFGKKKNISCDAVRLVSRTYSHFASCFGGDNFPDKTSSRQHIFRKSFYSNPWELELEIQSVFDFVDRMKDIFHFRAAGSPKQTSELDRALPISVN